MLKKINLTHKLIVIAILSLFIPGTYFTAVRTDINLYVIKVLFYTSVITLSISFIFSFVIKKFLNKPFILILCSFLLMILVFFSYDKVRLLVDFLLQKNFISHHGEISFILTIILSFIFFLLSVKKNKLFINFLTIFLPLVLIINIVNSLSRKKNIKTNNYPIFSTESYFKEDQANKVLKIKNNKNMYYISIDGALTLQDFNDKIHSINTEDILFNFEKHNFINVDQVKSHYHREAFDIDNLALAEIFNLNYFENAQNLYRISDEDLSYLNREDFFSTCKGFICIKTKSDNGEISYLNLSKYYTRNHITSKATFPTILNSFNQTPLGKSLNKIDYDFIWAGSLNSNCVYFNTSLCLDNKKKLGNLIKYYLQIRSMTKSNYVLRNYLHQTPIIDSYEKINKLGIFHKYSLKNSYYEIDSIERFIKKPPKKEKKYFTFIHFGMPKINFASEYYPVLFNEDCSPRSENKIINLQPLGPQKIQYLGKLKNYYKSNYLCMIKKINKFIKFLNIFDPEAVVVIQAGYNVPVFSKDSVRNDYNIFTLVKATEKCKKKLSDKLNNINATRLLLSCATNQEPNFINIKEF